MNDIICQIRELLGDDADLLTRSDTWLEAHRRQLTEEITSLTDQLRNVVDAQSLKRRLQDKNLVALQRVQTDKNEITDIVIELVPAPTALAETKQARNFIELMNNTTQQVCWDSDGYDLAQAG